MRTWRLRGPAEEMVCTVAPAPGGFAVALRQGQELILTEWHDCLDEAILRATELHDRLRDRGWREIAVVH